MAAFGMVKVTTKYVSLFFAMRDNKSWRTNMESFCLL